MKMYRAMGVQSSRDSVGRRRNPIDFTTTMTYFCGGAAGADAGCCCWPFRNGLLTVGVGACRGDRRASADRPAGRCRRAARVGLLLVQQRRINRESIFSRSTTEEAPFSRPARIVSSRLMHEEAGAQDPGGPGEQVAGAAHRHHPGPGLPPPTNPPPSERCSSTTPIRAEADDDLKRRAGCQSA